MLVTAIVKKCNEQDQIPGHFWCIYKHREGADKILTPQPKGWPKHYETKEKALKGLKMMKTFGRKTTRGWYTRIVLPQIYMSFLKDPGVFRNAETLISSISHQQTVSFLKKYKPNTDELLYWATSMYRVRAEIRALYRIAEKLCTSGFQLEAQALASIYNDLDYAATKRIFKQYYAQAKNDRNQFRIQRYRESFKLRPSCFNK